MEGKKMGEKEKRIRSIVKLYYSKPGIQQYLIDFARDREAVPSYMMESFGKRPDTLQYPSDIQGLVNKGATSFHCSEELWYDALQINSDMNRKETDELRKGWDLLIDIDSPFFDCSKIAAQLIIEVLEKQGVKNYGLKFSGSKGFHIIVPKKAFPEEYLGEKTKDKFPEWPRAISQFLMSSIREKYNLEVGKIVSASEVAKRTGKKEEDLESVRCKNCGRKAFKGKKARFRCNACGMSIDRRNVKTTKRRLVCLDNKCPGILEALEEKDYYYCENCEDFDNSNMPLSSEKHPELFEKTRGLEAEEIAGLDLVLVSPRHLFRMPYSLHEKTSLASAVLKKEDIENFSPKDAEPLKVKLEEFMPLSEEDEALGLLSAALNWKKGYDAETEKIDRKKYGDKSYGDTKIEGVTEAMFPPSIVKLLKGLKDGRKRGLFVLITFLRSLNFTEIYIRDKVKEWNEKNEVPLREGYVKSQLDWHFKQKRKILPPNYENESFYRDIGIINERPKAKNPIVEVLKKLRRK